MFRLGFLARKDSYEMGVPAVPLGRLYASEAWKKHRQRVEFQLRSPVERIVIEDGAVRAVITRGEELRGGLLRLRAAV